MGLNGVARAMVARDYREVLVHAETSLPPPLVVWSSQIEYLLLKHCFAIPCWSSRDSNELANLAAKFYDPLLWF